MKRLLLLALALTAVVACHNWNSDDDGHNRISCLPPPPGSIQSPVPLGRAGDFIILAHETVTNTGPSRVTGDIGVGPGSAVTGFPPGTLTGEIHKGDEEVRAAELALTAAYNDAADRRSDATIAGNIGGRTFAPGVFTSHSSLAIESGDLTLSGHGVYVFQVGSSLTVTSGRRVILRNGAKEDDVFWQVGSSATLGTTADFSGTVMALQSISLSTGARLHGRALARNGAVTLDSNVVSN